VNPETSILAQLMAVVEDRKLSRPEKSYTTKLLAGGLDLIGRKVLEEARETIAAAAETGPEGHAHLVYEIADLAYHLLVLMAYCDVRLDELEAELARRFGVSGIAEKAAREQPPTGADKPPSETS